MKTYFPFIICWLFALSLHAQTQLTITAGTEMTFEDQQQMVLNNTRLAVNGTLNPDSSTLILSGSGTARESAILGTGPVNLFQLELDRGADSAQLETNVSVEEAVIFSSGLLDLNGQDIDLGNLGELRGENEQARITSTSTGEVITLQNLIAPLNESPGNLGMEITSTAALGITEIRRGHSAQNINGADGVKRYYLVTPTTNTQLDATLRFAYFNAERNGHDESMLALYQSLNAGNTWNQEGLSGRDTTLNFIHLTGLDSLYLLTASTASAFPLEWLDFEALPVGLQVLCKWTTASEVNTDHFVVEHSLDGRTFSAIGKVNANSPSAGMHSYAFRHDLPHIGLNYYRIQQIDLNGDYTFSPIREVTFAQADLHIFPNPVIDVIHLSLPTHADAEIRLYTLTGQLVHRWNVAGQHFTIDATPYAVGTYVIEVVQGETVFREKIVKKRL